MFAGETNHENYHSCVLTYECEDSHPQMQICIQEEEHKGQKKKRTKDEWITWKRKGKEEWKEKRNTKYNKTYIWTSLENYDLALSSLRKRP